MFSRFFRRPRTYTRRFLLEALEERIVFDAAVADANNDQQDQQGHDPQAEEGAANLEQAGEAQSAGAVEAPDPLGEIFNQDLSQVLISNQVADIEAVSEPGSQDDVRVLVVSSAVAGADELADAARDDVITVVYDAGADTLDAIGSAVEAALDGKLATSIAFATHEQGEGGFQLTEEYTVTSGSILTNSELQSFWENIGDLLSDGGRVDILACDLTASAGGNFVVRQIEELTDGTVAASDDPTGSSEYGGDWMLETGDVDLVSTYFDAVKLTEFAGILDGENEPPSLSGDITLAPIGEYDSTAGELVSDLLAGVFSDPDGELQGIAVTANTADAATEGAWQYSTDNGTTWSDIGTVSSSSALLIGRDGLLRFAAVDSGDPGPLGIRALDDTYGGTYSASGTVEVRETLDVAVPFWAMDITGDTGPSQGAAMGDVDGDGDLDIYVADYVGQNLLWINDGSGSFSARDIPGDTGFSEGAVMGDVDGDGDLDIYVTNYYDGQNRLWINDGSGSFLARDIPGDTGDSRGTAMGDVDGDGDLDIYVTNSDQPNRLWINDGSGNFSARDISGDTAYSYGAVMGDVDGDGDLDIYVTNLDRVNRLWMNDGNGYFTENDIPGDVVYSTDAVMGDVDDDGDLDIYAVDDGGQNKLWMNDGSGNFTANNIPGDTGSSFGAVMGDVDDDGDLDIYVRYSGQNRLWLNDGAGNFSAHYISGDTGSSRGAVMGDVDGDGDLDIYVANQNAQNRLWINSPGSLSAVDRSVSIHVYDAPDLSGLEGTFTYTEGSGAQTIDTDISLTDKDSADMLGATVQISSGYENGFDELGLSSAASDLAASLSVAVGWDSSNGVLALTGSAPTADYESMLEGVTYINTSDDPTNTDRTVTFAVNDGVYGSEPVTKDIVIEGVNDRPILSGDIALAPVAENEISSGETVSDLLAGVFSDPDSELGGIVVLANTADAATEGVWQYSSDGGATWSDIGSVGSSCALLIGKDGILRFVPVDGGDPASLSIRALDDTYGGTYSVSGSAEIRETLDVATDSSDSLSAVDRTVSIHVHDAPDLYGLEDTFTYNVGSGAQVIDVDISVTDKDSADMLGATIAIGSGYENGPDELGLTTAAMSLADSLGLTVHWNTDTGVLTLAGSAPKADYESILEGVTYTNTSDDPNTNHRTVTFTVSDGEYDSDQVTKDIVIEGANDRPVLNGDIVLTPVAENEISSGETVSDLLAGVFSDPDGDLSGIAVDANTADAASEGSWQYSSDGGTTWSDIGSVSSSSALLIHKDGLLRFSPVDGGDPAPLSIRALDDMYQGAYSVSGSAEIRETLDVDTDGSDSLSAVDRTVSIHVYDSPDVYDLGGALVYTAGDGTLVIDGTVTLVDHDSAEMARATIEITTGYRSGRDELGLTDDASALADTRGVTVNWDSGTGVLALTGSASQADYESILEGVTYTNTSDTPYTNLRIVTFMVNDGEYESDPVTKDIIIKGLHDGPYLHDDITLTPIAENELSSGEAVSDLLVGVFSDPDDELEGIAVVANTADAATEGIWQYSSDDGTTWSDIGSVSSSSALLIGRDSLLRFLPVDGGDPGPLSIRALDDSCGCTYSVSGADEIRETLDLVNMFTAKDISGDTGYSETSVMGDIDGDGDLDIYVANSDNQQNKLWINDGSGNFSAHDITGDGGSSKSASMGDVDGDGDLDIYVANSDNQQNKLWINDGSGNFSAQDISGDTDSSYGAVMGDVDGDGDLDIYVANFSGHQNKLWINDGLGNFSAQDISGDTGFSTGQVMGDVDNDGDLDIYVANDYNQQNKLWLNDGSGSFSAQNISDDTGSSYGAVMGDVDNDGDLDIYVANYRGEQNKLWVNDGSGNFSAQDISGDTVASYGVVMGDVDDDGDLDIYVGNFGQNNLWVNDGFGNFSANDISGDIRYSGGAAMGDVDGDGYLDIYVANEYNVQNRLWINNMIGGLSRVDRTVSIHVYDAPDLYGLEGTFTYTEGSGAQAIDTDISLTDKDSADMLGATVQISSGYENGLDELGLTTATMSLADSLGLAVHWNAGTGVLTLSGSAPKAEYESMLEGVTYTNTSDDPTNTDRTVTFTVNDGEYDSDPVTKDIVISPVNDSPILSGDITLTPIAEDEISSGEPVSDLLAGVFSDPDGELQGIAVVANTADAGTEGIWQYSSDGGATWSDIGPVSSAGALLIGKDGLLRFVPVDGGDPGSLSIRALDDTYGGAYSVSGSVEIRETLDVGSPFSANDISGDAGYSWGAVAGDVDGDRDLDIYVANYWHEQNKLWINDGSGTFLAQDIGGDTQYSAGAVMGDVDGDGDLDIYVANGGQNKLWINDGSGSFSAQGIGGDSDNFTGAVMGDVDGDGDLDIYVANYGQQNKLWINDGTGSFSAQDIAGDTGDSRGAVMGDVDGDGDLDIYVANYGQQNKLWINDGFGNFSAQDISGDTGSSYGAVMGDVDGDGCLDIYVANYVDEQNKLWINDGTGSFSAQDIAGDTGSSEGAAMGDVDGDGYLDIYVANYWGEQNKLWINDGTGSFSAQDIAGDTGDSRGAVMGDVDGDGYLDIYVANYGQQNKLWINIGHSFSAVDRTVSIHVYEAPELSDLGGTLAYTEGDGALVIDADITLTDKDSAEMSSATVEITAGYHDGEDELGLTAAASTLAGSVGVNVDWDSFNGVLTLTGTASQADYESMLEGVTYTNTSDDPDTAQRTVTFAVNDGEYGSDPVTKDILVVSVNDSPTLSGDMALADAEKDSPPAEEQVSALLAGVFSDPDGELEGIAVVANTADAATEGVWQYSSDDGATWSDIGSVSSSSALLIAKDGLLRFLPVAGCDPGPLGIRALDDTYGGTYSVSGTAEVRETLDVGTTGTDSLSAMDRTVAIHVYDAPALSDLGGTLAYTEDDGARVIDADITLTDTDSSDMQSAEIEISAGYLEGEDELGLTSSAAALAAYLSVTVDWDSFNGVLTLNGEASQTDYESMLEGVTYTNTSDDPDTNAMMVAWTVTDSDGYGSEPASSTITVDPKAGAPTVTLDAVTAIEETGIATVTGTIVDSDTTDTFTLQINWGDPLSPDNVEQYTFGASAVGSQTFTLTHRYVDDNPSSTASDTYIIDAVVTDDDFDGSSGSTMVQVNNIAPVFSGTIADQTIAEGGTASIDFTGMFTDVPADTVTFAYQVDGGTWVDLGASTTFGLTLGDDGTYNVVVRAEDDDSGSTTSNVFTVTFTNADPTVNLAGVAAIVENGTATLTGAISDVGTLDTFTLDIDWGDGNTDTNVSYNSDGTFTATHRYLDDDADDTYTITATATDDDGGVGTQTTDVTVTNLDPVFSGTIGNQTIAEGGTASIDFTGMFGDVPADTLTYAYSIDGGTWVDLGTPTTFGLTLGDDGTYGVVVRAVDDDGGSVTSNEFTVTVTNVDPSIVALSATSVDEDGVVHLTGTYSDPGTGDTHTLTINWGEGSPETVAVIGGTFDITHLYLDDNPTGTASDTYTIGVTLTDDDTGSAAGSTTTTITNVDPTVTLNNVTSVVENGTATLTGTIADVGTLDTLTLDIDWGDGNQDTDVSYNADGTFSATHQYLDDDADDSYTITATVTDDDGGSGTETTNVTVTNADPTVALDNVSAIIENGVATLTGTIADVGTLDTLTLDIDWGDGNQDTDVSYNADSTFSATHQYLDDDADDTYTITATVKDDEGGSGTDTTNVTVTNLDPVFTGTIGDQSIDEGGTATVDFTGMFSDVAGDTLTFAYQVDGGTWVDLGASTAFGLVFGDDGTHNVVVRAADDDGGGMGSNVFTVTVKNVAPGLTVPISDCTMEEGEAGPGVNLHKCFSDVLGDLPLSFTYDDGNGNAGAVSDPANFCVQYDNPGDYTVTVTAHDGDGGSRSLSFTVTAKSDPSGEPMGYEPLGTEGPQGVEPQEEEPPVGSYYNEPVFAGGPSSIEAEELPPTRPAQQPGGEQPATPTGGSSPSHEPPEETGDGDSGPSTPPVPGANILTGLPGYYEHVLKGGALVFNLDNVHCTDLCTPLVLAGHQGPTGGAGGVTGLSSYLDGIKAGKSLVFNLDEIDCWALCEGGRG